jgi:hypothetical protein
VTLRFSQTRASVTVRAFPSPRFSGGEGLRVGGDSVACGRTLAPHPVRLANHPPRRFAGGGLFTGWLLAQGETA